MSDSLCTFIVFQWIDHNMCSNNGHWVALLFKLTVESEKTDHSLWVQKLENHFCGSVWPVGGGHQGNIGQYCDGGLVTQKQHILKRTESFAKDGPDKKVLMTDNLQDILTGVGRQQRVGRGGAASRVCPCITLVCLSGSVIMLSPLAKLLASLLLWLLVLGLLWERWIEGSLSLRLRGLGLQTCSSPVWDFAAMPDT